MTALDDRPAVNARAESAAVQRLWGQLVAAERQVALRDARLAEEVEWQDLLQWVLALAPYTPQRKCVGSLDDWVTATADRDSGRCAALRKGRKSAPPRFCRCKGHPHGPAVRYATAVVSTPPVLAPCGHPECEGLPRCRHAAM